MTGFPGAVRFAIIGHGRSPTSQIRFLPDALRRSLQYTLTVDIAELKRKSVTELQDMAEGLNIPDTAVAAKPELIFRIEQNLLDSDVALHGEGVLEILPEGYGFLRSQDYSYLAGPDDIYVSPSQIKRFGLLTGDLVRGQVRPPKAWERYLALLKVESVNGRGSRTRSRLAFPSTIFALAIPTPAFDSNRRMEICRCGWSTSSLRSEKDSAA